MKYTWSKISETNENFATIFWALKNLQKKFYRKNCFENFSLLKIFGFKIESCFASVPKIVVNDISLIRALFFECRQQPFNDHQAITQQNSQQLVQ